MVKLRKLGLKLKANTEKYTLFGTDRVLINVHPGSRCRGDYCSVHNHSNHHMKSWPQNWRDDRGMMERICAHGVGHPDPDDPSPDKVHGCDGCCRKLDRPKTDRKAAVLAVKNRKD